MSLSNVFNIAGSAMTAQSLRLNTVASNMANADSVTSSNGTPYRAKQVIFSAENVGAGAQGAVGVRVKSVIEDNSPLKLMYDPKHPLADAKGYVATPNVNVVEEMINMLSASRSYQNNVDMASTAKTLLLKTLTMGQ